MIISTMKVNADRAIDTQPLFSLYVCICHTWNYIMKQKKMFKTLFELIGLKMENMKTGLTINQ